MLRKFSDSNKMAIGLKLGLDLEPVIKDHFEWSLIIGPVIKDHSEFYFTLPSHY